MGPAMSLRRERLCRRKKNTPIAKRARTPRATPTPIPAFAPVESPPESESVFGADPVDMLP